MSLITGKPEKPRPSGRGGIGRRAIDAIEKAKDDLGKVNAAALAMIETPMDLIKAVLLKHEVAVIEVMCELHQQQQADEALLRQALEALEFSDWYTRAKAKSTIAALRERLGETK